ncbi:MAG: Dabb family protein [Nitrospirota bacterium]
MLKHIVLFKLKDSAGGAGKDQNAWKLKAAIEALAGKIPQIVTMEVGINTVPAEAAYDVALYSEFSDKDGLEIYQKHPEHMKVVDLVKSVAAGRVVVDYVI